MYGSVVGGGVAASDLSRQSGWPEKQAEPHQWCQPEFLAREPIKIGNFWAGMVTLRHHWERSTALAAL